MAVLKTIDQANNITAQTVVTTAETLIVTSPNVILVNPNGFIVVLFYWSCNYAAGSTAVTPRVRRGSTLAGTLMGNPQAQSITASTTGYLHEIIVDTYQSAGTVQYVGSIQLTAASANSTVQEAVMLVLTF